METVKTIIRPNLHRTKSEPNLGAHKNPHTEVVALIVPKNAVSVLLQAPATRRVLLEAQYEASALSAAFSEVAYIEKAEAERAQAIGLKAIHKSASRQARAMRHHADKCRAQMRSRRAIGKSELQYSNWCSIRLKSCWKSPVPIPHILTKLLENNYLDFRRISSELLDSFWEHNQDAYRAFVDALCEPMTKCRWKDPSGALRTETTWKTRSENHHMYLNRMSLRIPSVSSSVGVFDDSRGVCQLTQHEYEHEMQPLKFSTILALRMHSSGDFQNFGRIVACKPEVLWTELKALKEGAIFEEEGMHTILNIVVKEIVRTPGRRDPLNRSHMVRDMFQHFTEFHATTPQKDPKKPTLSSWAKNKAHDPESTGKDQFLGRKDDERTPMFRQYMERSLALDNIGSLRENIYGSALMTAIVAGGAMRYAVSLKNRDTEDKANLDFYLGLVFSSLKVGVTASPMAYNEFGQMVDMLRTTVLFLIDHSPTWAPRDISNLVVQSLLSLFYNPAVDGISVPGLGDKIVALASSNAGLTNEQERRMELGRHYVEMSTRYLAELLPNLALWTVPVPQSYIPL